MRITAVTPDTVNATGGVDSGAHPPTSQRKGRGTAIVARAVGASVAAAAILWLANARLDARRLDAGLFLGPVANRLLNGESYGPELLLALNEELSPLLRDPACDYQARQDIAVVRVGLVEAAFQEDDADLADRRLTAAEEAARLSLACSPGSTISWTILAWVEHVRNEDTPLLRSYLDMSYRTGPYNGWGLVRRMELDLRLYPALNDNEKARLREALDWIILKQLTYVLGEQFLAGTPKQRDFLREVLSAAPEREQNRAAEFIRNNGQDIDLPLAEPLGSRPWK